MVMFFARYYGTALFWIHCIDVRQLNFG